MEGNLPERKTIQRIGSWLCDWISDWCGLIECSVGILTFTFYYPDLQRGLAKWREKMGL